MDRHAAQRPDAPALIWVSTEVDQEVVYSFAQLQAEVQRMAAILLELGVQQGDRVLVYMPMTAEAAFTMLACARIGAVHSVVFGGFASHSLATRIDDAEPSVIVSSDAGSRGGKVVPYKPLLDEAITLAKHKPKAVLMVDRGLAPFQRVAGRDADYATLRSKHMDAKTALCLAGIQCAQLHALHQRHHRQAQGRAARHRRLLRGAGRVDAAHLHGQAWAKPTSAPATSAGWWATATSSTAR